MPSIHVNLPEELQQFVQRQIEDGGYRDASDYLEALVARAKRGKERLESLLIAGLNGPEAGVLDESGWTDMRGEVHDRLSE